MLSLLSGEKKLSELKAEVDIRETSILHALKEFENLNLTSKTSGTYRLTSLGLIEAQICKDSVAAAQTLEEFKDFWLYHDVVHIPKNLILQIGALKDSFLIRTDTLDLGKVYSTFLEILSESKKILGISPIYHPDYVKAIGSMLEQGTCVELILTSAVLNKTLSTVKVEQFQDAFASGLLKICLQENLKVALTITEKNFSLGLFSLGGEYDDRTDLVSVSPEAIQWGADLFLEYLKNSKNVTIEDLIQRS
jgi:predicted transcriptional regulator